jgi:cutinase
MNDTTRPADTSQHRMLRAFAAAVFFLAAGTCSQAPAAAESDSSCADVEVVFARGTFEAPGVGDTGQAFVDALNSRLGGRTVDVHAVDYPASLDFDEAAQGVIDATNRVESTAATCPHTKIVLGGYSQGAAVAGYTTSDAAPPGYVLPAGITGPMPASVSQHVVAVTLFGRPSNGFLDLVDRSAPPITIGHLYSAKALELCAEGDPVCGGGFDRAAHSAYKDNGMAEQAADFVASAVASSPS